MPTSGDYEYTLDGTNATITKYNGTDTDVVIPSTLDGYTVVSIGDSAFLSNATMTTVTIPNTVTTIEQYAFGNCSLLTSVAIPDSVTSIGNNAFYLSTSLTSITIPDSVTSIKKIAFYGCTSLTSIVIPNSVISIETQAFSGCTSLTTINLESVPTTIGANAFALGQSTAPVTCTIYSPNNIADGAFNAYKNEYTTFIYKAVITYKKLQYDDSKIQVESAVRDEDGVRIKTNYAKKSELTAKQDTLVSGTNIKTVNGFSLLGSGNVVIDDGEDFVIGNIFQLTEVD